MAYATASDMTTRFGETELIQLTDRANLGVLDNSVMDRALADAEAVIDGYLRAAGALPLASVPVILVRVACDLARFYLYDDRVTDAVQLRRDEAMKWLQDVANGRASLGNDASKQAISNAPNVLHSAQPRQFSTAANLLGY